MTRRRGGALLAFTVLALAPSLVLREGGAGAAPGNEGGPRKRSLWTRDLERSVRLFRAALAADPRDAEAATNLGRALSRLGRRDEAVEAYRVAIRLAPARWVAYAGFADVWSGDDRRWQKGGEVMEVLETGLARVPSDGSAVGLAISTANFERSIGRSRAARRRLEALDRLALSAEDRKRVLDLVETIRSEESARSLLDWPEPPVPPEALAALADAEALFGWHELRAAVASSSRLTATWPGWRAPAWLRARALEQLGSFDEAERQLTVLLQLAPSHAAAWRHLGVILAEHGGSLDAERADAALAQALSLDPGWWDLWLLRARVAVRRGRGEEAREMMASYLKSAGLSPCALEAGVDLEVGPGGAMMALGAGDSRCAEVEAQLAPLRAAISVEGGEAPRKSSSRPAPAPSARARDLYREAQAWLAVDDPIGLAPTLLSQALADSPAFVEAAVSAFAVGGDIPDATVAALWQDGDSLLDLARRVRPLVPSSRRASHHAAEEARPAEGEAAAPAPPPQRVPRLEEWLDRAVELGGMEARFERGLLRLDEGDREGGLDDLRRYVASGPRPPRLDEARVRLAMANLPEARAQQQQQQRRQGQGMTSGAALSDGSQPRSQAQEESAGYPAAHRCDARTPDSDLTPIGELHEWRGDLEPAAGCYRELLRRRSGTAAREPSPPASGQREPSPPGRGQGEGSGNPLTLALSDGERGSEPDRALRRIAEVAARAPMALVRQLEPELTRAVAAHVPVAEWALARLFIERGEIDPALARIDGYLAAADAEDPNREPARATRVRYAVQQESRRRQRVLERAGAALGVLAVVLLALLVLFRGRTVVRALERQPGLFPDVARAVGELRHDVLKHRTSALGLLASGQVAPEEVARILCEPERASDVIARTYQQLRSTSRARGVALRRLGREPIFGPLVRDLRRAEALVRRPSLSRSQLARLARLDARLRDTHAERLASLLRLGPRTLVDAERVASWIRGTEAELALASRPWSPPVLHLGRLDLEFPVEPEALSAIFGNLLRNAESAVAAHSGDGGDGGDGGDAGAARAGGVIVRVDEERDETGRRLLVIQVGDSSSARLTLSDIEARESGRGLAIVRDLVHEWRGHLAIRAEEEPWTKSVAACFPAGQ